MLGDLVRSAREALDLTPGELGDPEFSAMYVTALERGAVRPSSLALEFFANRAQVPLDKLREAAAMSQQFYSPSNVTLYEEDLHYQLNKATALIHSSQVDEALQLINTAVAAVQPSYQQLSMRARYRVPYTLGMAYLQVAQPGSAQQELETALRVVEELSLVEGKVDTIAVQAVGSGGIAGGVITLDRQDKGAEKAGEIEARVRNLLGVAYYMQKKLPLAEEQHMLCLRAVQAKKVTDQNLKFSIYRNLANDYWAAGKFKRAISLYKEALRVFEDLYEPIRLAGLHWGLAEAYRSAGDLSVAKLHMQKALEVYRERKAYVSVAMMAMNLAEALMDDRQYPEAEELLKEAASLLEQEKANATAKSSSVTTTGLGGGVTDPLLLCDLYRNYAILARGQGQLEKGATYAAQSTELGEAVHNRVAADSTEASAYPARHYVQALLIAALIKEDLGHQEAADDLFQRAISIIEETGFEETHEAVLHSYGEVLKARGDFERALQYLEKAAHVRIKANRTSDDL